MYANRLAKLSGLLLLTASLGACGMGDRLANVGQAPTLSPVEDPTAAKGYKPVQMPMPEVAHASYAPNSLWRTGSRAFFKDQRARNIGDLVTVKVKFTDRAQLENTTKRSRKNGEDFGAARPTRPARWAMSSPSPIPSPSACCKARSVVPDGFPSSLPPPAVSPAPSKAPWKPPCTPPASPSFPGSCC